MLKEECVIMLKAECVIMLKEEGPRRKQWCALCSRDSPNCCARIVTTGRSALTQSETEEFGIWQEIAAAVEEHRQEVGVVHLGLYGTLDGMVTSWQHHLEAVAEPSRHPSSPTALSHCTIVYARAQHVPAVASFVAFRKLCS